MIDLRLSRDRMLSLSRAWIVLHAIDEASPLWGQTARADGAYPGFPLPSRRSLVRMVGITLRLEGIFARSRSEGLRSTLPQKHRFERITWQQALRDAHAAAKPLAQLQTTLAGKTAVIPSGRRYAEVGEDPPDDRQVFDGGKEAQPPAADSRRVGLERLSSSFSRSPAGS
jgi:hypothetical protein